MEIGLATTQITPQSPVELCGWCFGRSRGTRDPLLATCSVFADADSKVVVISADLVGMGVELARSLRQEIGLRLGVGPERVCLCCTHTHSGPATVFLRHWGEIDAEYLGWLRQRLLDCAAAADAHRFEGEVVTVRRNVWGVGFNRRRPNGPVDPELLVVRLQETASGRLRGLLLSYACHPVILHGYRNLFSADYPGFVRARIRERTEMDLPILFLTGACGSINPFGTDVGHGNLEGAQRIGRLLGDAAVDSLADGGAGRAPGGAEAVPCSTVDACENALDLSVYPPPPREELERGIAQHEQALREAEAGPARVRHMDRVAHQIEIEWAREVLADLEAGRPPEPIEVVLQVLRIGDVVILGVSAEVFVEIGLAIKNRWYAERESGAHLCVATLANGDIGYLVDSAAYAAAAYEAGGLAYKVYGRYLIEAEAGDRVMTRLLEYPRWHGSRIP
ncbi:MAG: hypothetical protein AB1505_22115 [Candidatus Latescibacterota bacterium]